MRDDYSRIQQAAIEAKKSKHISDWVIKKIVKNYTEIKITAFLENQNAIFLSVGCQ